MDPQESAVYQMLSEGTPFLARDIFTALHEGSLLGPLTDGSRIYYPKSLANAVSRALDKLGRTRGALCTRSIVRWQAPPVGIAGQVLTSQGLNLPPKWR